MSIGTNDILLHAAGILRTVPNSKRIERCQATCSTLAERDEAFLGMGAARVDPLDRVADGAVTGSRLFNVALNNTAVIDGYIAGATLFVDANGKGVQDPGEFSTISDANGKFDMSKAISAGRHAGFDRRQRSDHGAGKQHRPQGRRRADHDHPARQVIEILAGRPPETTSAEG